jgi:hypothetical protein
MARRNKDAGGAVSLFPFLSILVCVIGCLTMIIVVVQLMQMNKVEGREPEEVERAKEYVELEKDQVEQGKDIEKRRADLEKLIQANQDFTQQQEKLRQMETMLENSEESNRRRDELIAELNLLLKTNEDLDKDHGELVAQIIALKEEIEKRKLPPDIASVVVKPSGSGSNIEPYFVEVADKLVRIHRTVKGPPQDIPIASINQDKDFVELLERIAAEPYRKLILLVRANDGAVDSHARVATSVRNFNSASGSQIIPGKLPLPGEGPLDLSLFAEFLK